ncbi:hypothetical protein BCR44DRAFT_56126 [Catenaria anguillulae PL171]|uniref:Probable 26S proteasome regulatory subunit p27 n=1 Tax=Catenaria anguillulae PL171 TaxID=765915 RepID=A0A1Y2HEF8_9FUNG|nr:hypothetical protein BCR44DRAFT_56126 [Catenaria anguillulae PL171]
MMAGAPFPGPAGSSMTATPTPRQAAIARAQALIREKDDLERTLKELNDILASHGVGMDDTLVDSDGFPRADVDIYAIRHARAEIIRKRNDLKDIYSSIAAALEAVHQAPLDPDPLDPSASSSSSSSSKVEAVPSQPELVPFARVNAVSPDSPAAEAGLIRGDLIVQFGSLDHSNHDGLKALPPLVASHENRALSIRLRRPPTTPMSAEAIVTLTLTPKKWTGRGLLGCHIVPHTQ